MKFRPLRIDYDADAAVILQEAERREGQDQQYGGDDDGHNSRSCKRRCVIWLSAKTSTTTTAKTTWEDESHDGGNGNGGDCIDRSDGVETKHSYDGQEAEVESPTSLAFCARSIYSCCSNDNDNEEDEQAAIASSTWRAIPSSTAIGKEIPQKIIDIIGGKTDGTKTMGRRKESKEAHPYTSPRRHHYHDRNTTQCDESMAFNTHGTKRGLGLDDEDENSSFVAVFRPPQAYIDWMKEDAVKTNHKQSSCFKSKTSLRGLKEEIARKAAVFKCPWLLNFLSSLRRQARLQRLANTPSSDRLLHTTFTLEEKCLIGSKIRPSVILADLWQPSLPNNWHPPSSKAGITVLTAVHHAASFGSRGKTLLRHCTEHGVLIDGGWESFGFLTSRTTSQRHKFSIFFSLVFSSALVGQAILARGTRAATMRLDQMYSFYNGAIAKKALTRCVSYASVGQRYNILDATSDNFRLILLGRKRIRPNMFACDGGARAPLSSHDVEETVAMTIALSVLPGTSSSTRATERQGWKGVRAMPTERSNSHESPRRAPIDRNATTGGSCTDSTMATPGHQQTTGPSQVKPVDHERGSSTCHSNNGSTEWLSLPATPSQEDPETMVLSQKDDLQRHEEKLSTQAGTQHDTFDGETGKYRAEKPQPFQVWQASQTMKDTGQSWRDGNFEMEDGQCDSAAMARLATTLDAQESTTLVEEGAASDHPIAASKSHPVEKQSKQLQDDTAARERALLERFGLFSGYGATPTSQKSQQVQDPTNPESAVQGNAKKISKDGVPTSPKTFHAQHQERVPRVDDRTVHENRGSASSIVNGHNFVQAPGRRARNDESLAYSPNLWSGPVAMVESSPEGFPIYSPAQSTAYGSDGGGKPHAPAVTVEKTAGRAQDPKKSEKKRKRNESEVDRANDKSKRKKRRKKKKESKREHSREGTSSSTPPQTPTNFREIISEKRGDNHDGLETPKKMEFNDYPSNATENEEFQWESLEVTDLTSPQKEAGVEPSATDGKGDVKNLTQRSVDQQPAEPPRAIRLLCSEHFMENYGATVVAKLAGRGGQDNPSMAMISRIECIDNSLVGARGGVDIEIPRQGAIVVCSVLSLQRPEEVERILGTLLDAAASTRYRAIEVLVSVDTKLDATNTRSITRLQCALFQHQQLPRTLVTFRYTSLSSLHRCISESVSAADPTGSCAITPDMAALLEDKKTIMRLSFLLDIVPSLSVGGALQLFDYGIRHMPDFQEGSPDKDLSAKSFQQLFADSNLLGSWLQSDPWLFDMLSDSVSSQFQFLLDVPLVREPQQGLEPPQEVFLPLET